MWRFSAAISALFSIFLLFVMSGLLAPDLAVGQVAAQAPLQPSVTCSYSPLSLTLTGSGNAEDVRPFVISPGESYFQFAPAEPITTTNFSNGAALLNGNFSGSVSGDVFGSFSIGSLNGMAVTGSTNNPNASGFEANSMVITDAQGSITLLLVYNFTSGTATAPYYPRTITGNVQSTSGTGAYSQLKFAGAIIGTIGAPSGGTVSINASIQGRLFTAPTNAPVNRRSNPSRNLPVLHGFSLLTSDTIAQFHRSDIHPRTTAGNFTPNSVFSGALLSGNSAIGTARVDAAQMVAGTQLDFSPGWAIGNWRMYESQGYGYGPLLADQNGPFPNGYYFQTGGTGSYAGGLMVSPMFITIAYQGGRDMTADPVGGYRCTDFAPTQPTLVGHVNWEARPSQPSHLQSLPITLTLKSGTTEMNYQGQYTDQYGFFTVALGTLPNDTYSWRVDDSTTALHSPNYLSNAQVVTLDGAPITNVEMDLMRTGDANNDDIINVADFTILKAAFGFGCGNTAYDNRADFTGDCVVNVTDFNPLKNNFGQGGAPPVGP